MLLNISIKNNEQKQFPQEVIIDTRGIVGDAHAGSGSKQVSLLCKEDIDALTQKTGKQIEPNFFGENLIIGNLDHDQFSALDQLHIGEEVILEITLIGKKCYGDVCAIYREFGKDCIMPKGIIFTRVIRGGKIKVGDKIIHQPRPLKILLITLSDRAFAKEYEDKSGPAAREILAKFFASSRWHYQIKNALLPDDAMQLEMQLNGAVKQNVDIIFTLGGTGIGPRDITADVVNKFCDKIVGGVMENIRLKYGATNPAALLSRSVFGIKSQTQIYALPGSVKAVTEYLAEILKTLRHAIFMLHRIDTHCH